MSHTNFHFHFLFLDVSHTNFHFQFFFETSKYKILLLLHLLHYYMYNIFLITII